MNSARTSEAVRGEVMPLITEIRRECSSQSRLFLSRTARHPTFPSPWGRCASLHGWACRGRRWAVQVCKSVRPSLPFPSRSLCQCPRLNGVHQFLHGHASLLHHNPFSPHQLNGTVTGHTGEDCVACLGHDKPAVHHERHIHGAAFFHRSVGGCIGPKNLVIALRLGQFCGKSDPA